jgi:hypothetical protein
MVYWRKGDLAIVRMEELQRLDQSKVVGTVVTGLHAEQAQHLAERGLVPAKWRERFARPQKTTVEDMMPPSDSDEEDAGAPGGLNNRRQLSSSSE